MIPSHFCAPPALEVPWRYAPPASSTTCLATLPATVARGASMCASCTGGTHVPSFAWPYLCYNYHNTHFLTLQMLFVSLKDEMHETKEETERLTVRWSAMMKTGGVQVSVAASRQHTTRCLPLANLCLGPTF